MRSTSESNCSYHNSTSVCATHQGRMEAFFIRQLYHLQNNRSSGTTSVVNPLTLNDSNIHQPGSTHLLRDMVLIVIVPFALIVYAIALWCIISYELESDDLEEHELSTMEHNRQDGNSPDQRYETGAGANEEADHEFVEFEQEDGNAPNQICETDIKSNDEMGSIKRTNSI